MRGHSLTEDEKRRYYAEQEHRHPHLRHVLGDNPPAPFNLLPCRCGAAASPAFVRYGYGLPSYTVQCSGCGHRSQPQPWGVGLIFCENPHTITEREALHAACTEWNAEQSRAQIAHTVTAAKIRRCEP